MEKILQTRIQNKIDTHENWLLVADTFTPKNGEICIDVITTTVNGAVVSPPQTLIKVGDGTHAWGELNYMGAIAADIYAWAKAATKPVYQATEIQGLEDFISGEIQDTDTQYQIVKDGDMGFKLQSRPKSGGEWTDVSTITLTAPVDTLVEGDTNGTVKFNGTNVPVHGLGSAAYTESSAYDAAGAASAVQTALIGTAEDPSSANTINAAKKFATEGIDTAIGTLNLNAVTAGTGQVIGQIQQTDGAVTAQVKTLAPDDIPQIPQTKVTDLTTTLAGKQDTLVFNTAYNAESNKAATMTDVQNAVAGLSGAMHYVGESTTDPSTGTATVEGHEDWVAGDVVTYNAKEYVYDGENWRELGDESSFAVKGSITNADIASDAAIDQSKIANLTTDLAAKASQTDLDALETLVGETAVATQISNAIGALDVADAAVSGQFVTQVVENDGKITVSRAALQATDIPNLTASKITDLDTVISGAIDEAIAIDGAIDEAISGAVTEAIAGVAGSATGTEHQFLTSVTLANGVLTGSAAQPAVADINGLQAALDAKADDADLATIAKTGNVNDLVQTGGDVLVFQCGSSTVNV